jgi:hypothetical protein
MRSPDSTLWALAREVRQLSILVEETKRVEKKAIEAAGRSREESLRKTVARIDAERRFEQTSKAFDEIAARDKVPPDALHHIFDTLDEEAKR